MKRYLVQFIIPIIIFSFSVNARAFSRPEDHVIVKGATFSNILNAPIEKIRVFAVKNGKAGAIPFQIDKVDIDGDFLFSQKDAVGKAKKRREIYDDALDESEDHSSAQLANLKKEAEWTDDMNIFDCQDELVFMAWDLGDRAGTGALPKADNIEELAITKPVDSNTGYVYVAFFSKNAPPLSEKNYLSYTPKTDSIKTDFYTIDFEIGNPFVFKEARHRHQNGELGENYMDRVKMRFKMDIKYFLTLNFDEDNANAKLLAYKLGPVRLIRRMLFWLDLLHIPITPSLTADYLFYSNGLISPSVLDVTYDPQKTLNDGSYLLFSLDFSNINNWSKVYTEKTPVPVILDGTMSDEEKKLDLKDQNWFVVYKESKTGFIMQCAFNERLKNPNMDILYIDDKNVIMKPEAEPGSHLIGFKMPVKQFQKGKYIMYLNTYMNKSWTKGMEKRYLDFISHPLKAQARKIQ